MRSNAMAFPRALSYLVLASSLASCTLALDTKAVQCKSNADCRSSKGDGPALICQDEVCVVDGNGGGPGNGDASTPDGGDTQNPDKLPFAVDLAYFTSGYMGDGEQQLISEQTCPAGSRGGQGRGMCHKFVYRMDMSTKGWGGLYWQYPANNWEASPGYLIPKGAKSVAFYAWASAAEPKLIFKVGIFKADGFEEESDKISLTTSPKRYVMDISGVTYADVVGGFAFTMDAPKTGNFELFLDDIVWSDEPAKVATKFAVDTSAAPLAAECSVRLRGSFDNWGTGVTMKDDDKDKVYEVSVDLTPNQDLQYRFATFCDGGVVDEMLAETAPCAPITADGARARVAKVPHESSQVALTCLASCGTCGANSTSLKEIAP